MFLTQRPSYLTGVLPESALQVETGKHSSECLFLSVSGFKFRRALVNSESLHNFLKHGTDSRTTGYAVREPVPNLLQENVRPQTAAGK